MKLRLLGRRDHQERRWPAYVLRMRTSTLVLVVAFCALWWTYETYAPQPAPEPVPGSQVVPPGFVPDPAYTWVPRTNVEVPRTTTTTTPPTTTTTTTPTTTTETTPVPPPGEPPTDTFEPPQPATTTEPPPNPLFPPPAPPTTTVAPGPGPSPTPQTAQ